MNQMAATRCYPADNTIDAALKALRDKIKRLEIELDEANESARQWKDLAMALDRTQVPRFGLSPTEYTMFRALLRWPAVNRDQMMSVLYGHRDDVPIDKILDVMLHRVRRKLRPHGIRINTICGVGWALDAEARARIDEAAA